MSNAPLSVGAYGDNVARLQDFLRQQGFQLPASEVNRTFFGPATRQAVQKFQQQNGLPVSGEVDEQTAIALNAATAPFNAQNPQPTVSTSNAAGAPQIASVAAALSPEMVKPGGAILYAIQGNLVFDYGLPASGITVRLYNVGFAGQDVKLGETSSDDQGHYSLAYELFQGQMPNLQLRIVDTKNNEITLSTTKFNVHKQEVLNLIVPGSVRPLAPEFQRLAIDMDRQIDGIRRLGQAQENTNHQDLSLLYQTSGWDARLLALASSAASLTETTGMSQDVLYALVRAGLPTDPKKLALVNSTAIGKALVKANQSDIVSLNDQQITAATTAFKNFASKTRLTLTAPGARSTFGDLLRMSGLSADKYNAFADLYFSQSAKAGDFWQQVAALDIPVETLNALKLQGKLFYLTFNNADLVQSLQRELGSLDNLPRLPEKDFHMNTSWKNYLMAMSGPNNTQALDKLIPPVYQGETTSDRLEAYAADLARKVRLSFPTQVVSRMIEKGDLTIDANSAPKVVTFLKNAAPLGFQLGRTPFTSFLQQNQASLFQGIAPGEVAATTESVKTLYRLYQITPSNESLQAAMKLGVTSSYDLAALEFSRLH